MNYLSRYRFFNFATFLMFTLFFISCEDQEPVKSKLTLSSFSPPSGEIGTLVTISGTNFSTNPTDNVVIFNGDTAIVTSATTTKLIAMVPMGATDGKITISKGGVSVVSENDFTINVCLLAKITRVITNSENVNANGTTVITYEYDNDNRLIKIIDGSSDAATSFTYTNGYITTMAKGNTQEQWIYNDKNLLTHTERIGETYARDFFYNVATGKLDSLEVTSAEGYTQKFGYSGSNVTSYGKIKYTTIATTIGNGFYSRFDIKKNPYQLLAKAMGNQLFYVSESMTGANISKNNAKQEDDELGVRTSEYEYNTNSYPKKITTIYSDSSRAVITLEYTGCE